MSPFISSTVYFCLLTNQSCQEFVYLYAFWGNNQFFILLIRQSARSWHCNSNPQKLRSTLKTHWWPHSTSKLPRLPVEPAYVSCSTPLLCHHQRHHPAQPPESGGRFRTLCRSSFSLCFHESKSGIPNQVFICCEGFSGPFHPALPAVITFFSVCVFAAHILTASIVHHVLVVLAPGPWGAVQSIADFCISGTFN